MVRLEVQPDEAISGLVEHLFRRSAGRIVSTLARVLGPENLELAEEVVQEALLKALRIWPHRGVPSNPEAWLRRVARNRAIDVLRRRRNLRSKLESVEGIPWDEGSRYQPPRAAEPPIGDAELAMIFMCCHPALPLPSQLALTLKTVGGFGVGEIAGATRAREATVAQRLVRAKRKIARRRIPIELPPAEELGHRLEAVLRALYLMFNEGYAAYQGESLIRAELCGEAIRLTELVADHPRTGRPAVQALLALMLFQASRSTARLDDEGALVLLADQDRALWDRELIARGFRALERSARGERVTSYHVQAAIAAVHAAAPDWRATDWPLILDHYDRLIALEPGPIVRLNRAVALSMVEGPRAAIAAIEEIVDHPELEGYYLLPATLGDLWVRAGVSERAASYYSRAIELPCAEPERRFLERKLAECRS